MTRIILLPCSEPNPCAKVYEQMAEYEEIHGVEMPNSEELLAKAEVLEMIRHENNLKRWKEGKIQPIRYLQRPRKQK